MSTDDYTLAIAYPTSTGVSGSSGVRVDIYRVHDDGSTVPTRFFVGYFYYAGSPNTVHIDLIADYSNVVGGFAYCGKAVVTWDDGGSVYAAFIPLENTPGALSPVFIDYGAEPDVAAIGSMASGSYDYVARLTYTQSSGAKLMYNEWDITASTVSTATLLEKSTTGSPIAISHPRIDAIDNYNLNNSPTSQSDYKVVAQVKNITSGYYEIRTYDDYQLSSFSPAYWKSSQYETMLPLPCAPSASYNNYYPSVAYSGTAPIGYSDDGTDYVISHFLRDCSGYDILFMEPVDEIAPQAISGLYYFWVNETPGSTVATTNWANSVSTMPNLINTFNVFAWAYPGVGGGDVVEYKTTSSSYAFKHTPPASVSNVATSGWTLYPNPACDYLLLDNTGGAGNITSYEVTDMLGRNELYGLALTGSQQIDISSLVTGTYILKIYYDDGGTGQRLFVKK